KFKGDDETVIAKKLNNQLDIIGGADSTKLTEKNIGVNSTIDGKLKVQLAKDLTGITSISNQKTEGDKTTGAKIELSTDGTTTVSGGNVSVSGGKITNVGTGIEKDGAGNITEASKTNAANIGDVQTITESATNGLTNKGLTFAANSGTDYTAKLGSTVKIQGTDKKDGHEYTADNLTTEIDGSGNITILMDKNISADKIAVNGKDGKDAVSIAGKDGVGHIGLTGPAGTNGKNGADGKPGTSIDISVKNGYDGAAGTDGKDGIKGANGVDGTSLTRVVYTDQTGEHQVATMEDGLKFKGDDETVIAKKLNNQLDIIGGAAGTLTDGNIGVKSTTDGKLKVQLAQDLTKITSISNQTTTGAGDQAKTTGARIDLGSDGTTTISGGDVNVSGNKITHVGSGIEAEKDGKYAVTDANKSNAANIGDVDHMVNQAVGKLSNDTKVDLARKANVDASNLTADDVTKWQEKLGNGKVESGNTGLVTGDTVFKAVDTKANRDGSNLTDKEANSFSEKIARGEVKAGENRAVSGDAVSQAISKVTGDMNTKLDGKANTSLDNITDTGKNVIRDLAKGSVKVIDGTNTTVTTVEGKGEKPTTYAVNVEGKGTVTSGNTGLISGGTAYTELRPADGSYVKQSNTTASNLTALDTQLKTTSDLIHTNAKGDAIQIGGDSTATKIDISGKDKNGKSTGRVITGVVSDVNDPNSAANVGYVNGITSASNEQIYHDMNMQYNHVENDISRAAAGSNALAALHPMQEFDPDDKAQFALGYGHYRNSNAGAVGAFYQPDENSMVNFGVSFGNGDAGINAGVTFKFGPGGSGHHALTKTQMAKVIDAQSKEIDELKKDNADKDKRIDALEQKMTEILAKLDKSKD
ncbi:YadA-like family protein, partial [Mitsuokella multacida]|uniref:YadA-like family protein n=1 Tax=Mitsuokella multacida TaxID=52226 RepID=UPI0022E37673